MASALSRRGETLRIAVMRAAKTPIVEMGLGSYVDRFLTQWAEKTQVGACAASLSDGRSRPTWEILAAPTKRVSRYAL